MVKAMPFANNQGVRIHYKVEGKGPSLVLHHGLMSSLQSWYDRGYVDPLKKDYQLVLLDARGHGDSDKPHDPKAYELELLVDDIVTVLDDLEVHKAHFFGYSMGGRIGFGVAKYSPKRFHSFVIGGAHPYKLNQDEHDAFLQLFKQGMDAVIVAMEKAGLKMTPEMKARWAANDSEALAAFWSASQWLGLEDVLPTMTMPCLVFVGEADSLHSGAKECAKSMSNATFISFPGLGHFEVVSQSSLMLPHITKFLANVIQT